MLGRDEIVNVMSVDVEDYFHPTEVQAHLGPSSWDSLPSRVESATMRTLDLLEEHKTSSTFFVLGWVAERYPHLIRSIAAAGHEIGCHSYAHQLVYDLTPAEFRKDTLRAVEVIEAACGVRPRAYRAPSYSITKRSLWALEILADCGFTHDSSIYPIAHDRYGIPGFERHTQILHTPAGPICEMPVATASLGSGRIAPVGGGAYLRLLPYRYTAAGIRRVNEREGMPACIYLHPWELDPEQPRLARSSISRFRTYAGLRSMAGKLSRLLSEFSFSTLTAVCASACTSQAQLGPAGTNRCA
jgi:polysaccharide deacetylase family protein (PEP-CTERM system associated)